MGELVPRNRRIRESNEAEDAIKHQLPNGHSVVYSAQYSDDTHIYRHVHIPRRMWPQVARLTAMRANRLLTYSDIVEKLGISMSADWKHYLSNRRDTTLFFKRARRS